MDLTYTTIYIIKPEAFEIREQIKDYICKNSILKVNSSRVCILEKIDIMNIFIDDIGTPLLGGIEKHLVGRLVEVVLVSISRYANISVSDELQRICGDHFNPMLCKKNTVRNQFGSSEYENYDGITYFLNAIHKASSTESRVATKWCIENIFT
jgi:nucleoside diphosphate kinase